MVVRVVMLKTPSMPFLLRFADIRSYLFITSFVIMIVMLPFIFHHFHLAGLTYLPTHIFVLLAGLLFGCRTGLIVGLFSPMASYAISGMPPTCGVATDSNGTLGIRRYSWTITGEVSPPRVLVATRSADKWTFMFIAGNIGAISCYRREQQSPWRRINPFAGSLVRRQTELAEHSHSGRLITDTSSAYRKFCHTVPRFAK